MKKLKKARKKKRKGNGKRFGEIDRIKIKMEMQCG